MNFEILLVGIVAFVLAVAIEALVRRAPKAEVERWSTIDIEDDVSLLMLLFLLEEEEF